MSAPRLGNTISASSFGEGGALYIADGTTRVTGSLFTNNAASGDYAVGGAIAMEDIGSTVTVANSTFTGNLASGGNTAAWGGAIDNHYGMLTVTNTTISGNSATQSGASKDIRGGGLVRVTGSNNALTVKNSLIVNNTGDTDCNNCSLDSTSKTGSVAFADAAPADHGGPTKTLALLPGSPALGAGDATTCANGPVSGKDQRGVTRPGITGLACDSGAFESQGFTVSKTSGDGQSVPLGSSVTGLTATVTSKDTGVTVNGGTLAFVIAPGAAGASFGAASGCTLTNSNRTAVCTLTSSGVATSPMIAGATATGSFTVTASAEGTTGPTDATYTETITKATITLTAPIGSARGNSGTATAASIISGVPLQLVVTGAPAGVTLTYTSSNPQQVTVSSSGQVLGITATSAPVTITVSGTGVTSASITVSVTAATGIAPQPGSHPTGDGSGGNPNPQPGTHPTTVSSGSASAQPGSHTTSGSGSGSSTAIPISVAVKTTATPLPQPGQH